MATHSPSGERHLGSSGVVASTAKPLAGRTKLAKRLDDYCRSRHTGRDRPPSDLPPVWPIGIRPMAPIERKSRGIRYAKARFCVACALSGALIAIIVAILIFVFTR